MKKIRAISLAAIITVFLCSACQNANLKTEELPNADNNTKKSTLKEINPVEEGKQNNKKKKSKIKKASSDKRGQLKVRLKGSFESAIVGQKKYDAVAGASGAISFNKNSNVKVQITEKENPEESDWHPINTSRLSFKRSTVKIEPSDSGMEGVFIRLDSTLILSGIPEREGNFNISVELHDESGRTAVSNTLPFNIYDTSKTTLEEILTKVSGEAWDMDPWNIIKFGGNGESITVPGNLKRWFGSHTSGTYGSLGYAVANDAQTTQTLIIESGSDLKLINMIVLSSVNIVVKNGAKLNLQDSSIHGTITVEDGGTFQMNYDNYGNKYTTGAQINGQLILKNGAKVDNSLIYSNTNNLANGNVARRNEEPVIAVTGNADIIGKVYVRGDESPTGNSPKTGKEYPGQPAMSVTNGSVTIRENAELGLFGGGRNITTTNGGNSLILDNGTIQGEGKLIAVAGQGGFSGEGGNAVTGKGTVDVKEAYLRGGNSNSRPGLPYTENITVTDKPSGQAIKGDSRISYDDSTIYWKDITKPPMGDYDTVNKPKIKN
ncbi:hypothetical protein [Treponema pedis]|uniref:hypothetical protein n=1 Tax=Treponema pedis TaxID=409322 RepID=UPI000402C46E|nr:hypothetical protein [Treponema pedis]